MKKWIAFPFIALLLSTLSIADEDPGPVQSFPLHEVKAFLRHLRKAARKDPGSRVQDRIFRDTLSEVAHLIAPQKFDRGLLIIEPSDPSPPQDSEPRTRSFTLRYATKMQAGISGEHGPAPQYTVTLDGTFTAGECPELNTCKVLDAEFSQVTSASPATAAGQAGGGSSSAGGG